MFPALGGSVNSVHLRHPPPSSREWINDLGVGLSFLVPFRLRFSPGSVGLRVASSAQKCFALTTVRLLHDFPELYLMQTLWVIVQYTTIYHRTYVFGKYLRDMPRNVCLNSHLTGES